MSKITGFRSSATSSAGIPSSAIRPPWAMFAIMLAQRLGVARHLEADVEALRHAELALHVGEVALRGVDGDGRAHPARQLEPVGVQVGDDDVPRARVAHDRGRHAADRAGAGDQHVLAEHGERRAPCAPRCRTGRRSRRRPRRSPASGARRSSSAARRTRRTRPVAARRGRSSARRDGGARPCSCGSARRRRAPRR